MKNFDLIVSKYKYIINNPYWIYQSNVKETLHKINVTGNRNIPFDSVKDFVHSSYNRDITSVTNVLATEIINAILLYGVNKFLTHMENKRSEYIVQLYLFYIIATSESDEDLLDIIDGAASDLVGMSFIKFYDKAEENINPTLIESFKGMLHQWSGLEYLSRRKDYVYANVKNRITAFMFNLSIIYDLRGNEGFERMFSRYLFDDYHGIKKFYTSDKSACSEQLEYLIEIGNYDARSNYIRCIAQRYCEPFQDIAEDV